MARYLVDTNILLRWTDSGAPEHASFSAAIFTLNERGDTLYVAPQNLVEFWSVATRPATSRGGLGLSPEAALTRLIAIEKFFPPLPETSAIYPLWRNLVVSMRVSGRHVHDARLAAVMRASGVDHILTTDTDDFERYKWLTAVHPNSV